MEYGNVSYRDLKARQEKLEGKGGHEGFWLGTVGHELIETKTGMELSNNCPPQPNINKNWYWPMHE